MRSIRLFLFLSIVLIPTVTIAGLFGKEGPSKNELENRLSMEIPGYWEIDDFKVEITEIKSYLIK